MKKTRFLLMLALCLALFCVSALAADPTSAGLYDLTGETGITITAQKADKSAVASGTSGSVSPYYADAVRVAIDYTAAVSGKEYLLVVTNKDLEGAMPTKDDIVYIDQVTAANNTASFNAYPASLGKQTYYLYLSSSASTGYGTSGLQKVGSFKSFALYKLGDITDDGLINISDAMAILNHLAGKQESVLSGTKLLAANVNGDSTVNISDAMEILNFLAGKPSDYLTK